MGYSRELNPEIKKKIAASNTGKVRSAETRLKMSAAKQGTKHSEETKAKISAAISKQWAKVPPKTDTDNSKPIGF